MHAPATDEREDVDLSSIATDVALQSRDVEIDLGAAADGPESGHLVGASISDGLPYHPVGAGGDDDDAPKAGIEVTADCDVPFVWDTTGL